MSQIGVLGHQTFTMSTIFIFHVFKICLTFSRKFKMIVKKTSHEDKPVTAGEDVVFGLDGFAVTGGRLGFKMEALSRPRPVFMSSVCINK